MSAAAAGAECAALDVTPGKEVRAFQESRPFRVPGYPLTPILFVVAAAALVVNTIVTQPGISSIGLAFVAFGAPVFYWWRGRGRDPGVPAVASPADGSER